MIILLIEHLTRWEAYEMVQTFIYESPLNHKNIDPIQAENKI